MKKYAKANEVRISEVTPKGWLREVLLDEKNGMTGNLHKIGYPFNTECWKYKSLAEGGYDEWWPYEQNGYRIDSIIRAAGILKDSELYGVVRDEVEQSISYDDDFIGPVELKECKGCYRWPMAVYFRGLYAKWSADGDIRFIDKMLKHYLSDLSDYHGGRDVVNIETMFKVYELTGAEDLYKKAVKAYELFDNSDEKNSNAKSMLTDEKPYQHGVTFNEQAKLAAIMYIYTGNEEYLRAAEKGYEKIDKYCMLPDGVHTSCEFTYGNETKWAHESCDISDYTWSVGYLLEATGNGKYADKIEKACFNAAFGAIGPHFRTIQYFSTVNQAVAARNSTTIKDFANTPRMAYQPHHYPECCVGNIGRAFPNYALRMYQRIENGIAASLYGDSVFDGEEMRIEQSGSYPFGDEIHFDIKLKDKSKNELKLRIPGWSAKYEIYQNNKPVDAKCENGYAALEIGDGDRISLRLFKEFKSEETPDGGIYYTYGPFVMSLKIKERWEVDKEEKRQTKEFPAYNVYPESDWAYAAAGGEKPEIITNNAGKNPFWDGYPIEIKIKLCKLSNWDLVKEKISENENKQELGIDDKQKECGATEVFGESLKTPELPDEDFVKDNLGDFEEVTLVPYGCTNLRITVFPKMK